MNDLSIFLNTRVENSGMLAQIGDAGLAPFRYLFNGTTVRIQKRETDQAIEVHHVQSFTDYWLGSSCRSDCDLEAKCTFVAGFQEVFLLAPGVEVVTPVLQMFQIGFAVAFLVPGLFLAVSKVFAYAYSDIRDKHQLAKEHFTVIDRHIGSAEKPIQTIEELKEALLNERNDPKNQRTRALIIHGNGELNIERDCDGTILYLNPMKLVLDGATIIYDKKDGDWSFDADMLYSHKWQVLTTKESKKTASTDFDDPKNGS